MANFSRRRAASAALAVALCLAPISVQVFAAEAADAPRITAATVSTVLELTNAERARAGLAPLRENPRLAYAAQLQSDQMGSISRLDHVLQKAPYPRPADRLAAARYAWQAYAENVAMGQRSAAEVVSAWMSSPSHRANILNPAYTELGVGVATDEAGRPYYAQVFGRPASS
jgi:uncharacterized protein YkwD